MNSFHTQILWVIASSKITLHIWLPCLQNELCVFVHLWCVQLPGNMTSSFVPVPLSHMAFPASNIFSNVCSEPKSSSRTAISFNLQLQSTLMCKTTMAFNHLGVRCGGDGGQGGNEKQWNEKQIRSNNLLFRFNYMFLFFLGACVICVQHWWGAQRQMACAVICQSFHSSLCRTNTHAHTNTCICAHMRSIWLSPLKAHLLKILPWDGTGAEIVAATFGWNAQKKKRGESNCTYKMMGNKLCLFSMDLVLSTKTSVIWQAMTRPLFLSSKELCLCPTTVKVHVSLGNHKHIHNYWRVEIIVILGKNWMY